MAAKHRNGDTVYKLHLKSTRPLEYAGPGKRDENPNYDLMDVKDKMATWSTFLFQKLQ